MSSVLKKINKMNFLEEKNKFKLIKHSLLGLVFNSTAILFSIFIIPILIQYLGKDDYGIWITVFSVCNWLIFLDGGLGNSLRNELTISLQEKDIKKSKALITTAYFSIFGFLAFLFLIILFAHLFINWNTIVADDSLNYNLLSLCVFGFFLIQMVFKIISKIFFSFGKSYMSFFVPAIVNFFYFLSFYLLNEFDNGSNKIWNVAYIYSFVPILILLLISLFFFFFKEPSFKPSFKSFEKKYMKIILIDGLRFFFIQMNAGLFLALTPFFITFWFASELTAEYHVSVRYYSLLLVLLNIILQNFWAEITKSFAKNDFKKSVFYFKISLLVSFFFVLILGIMLLISNSVYMIWLGEDFNVSSNINISSAIFVGVTIITKSLTNFLNASGNIKIQSPISLISLTLYFPLIYLSVKILNLGVNSLILLPVLLFMVQILFAIFEIKKIFSKIKTKFLIEKNQI